jgi:hypothetical protein
VVGEENVPLTEKGEKIKSAMTKQYGPEKGERVFYASKNKGKITGVDDAQHMGITAAEAEPVKKLVASVDALSTRLDAFEKRRAMKKPKKVEARTKDNMQPSLPHPKTPGGG